MAAAWVGAGEASAPQEWREFDFGFNSDVDLKDVAHLLRTAS